VQSAAESVAASKHPCIVLRDRCFDVWSNYLLTRVRFRAAAFVPPAGSDVMLCLILLVQHSVAAFRQIESAAADLNS
jgi:metallophosphoesterase superfamily enzyme